MIVPQPGFCHGFVIIDFLKSLNPKPIYGCYSYIITIA